MKTPTPGTFFYSCENCASSGDGQYWMRSTTNIYQLKQDICPVCGCSENPYLAESNE